MTPVVLLKNKYLELDGQNKKFGKELSKRPNQLNVSGHKVVNGSCTVQLSQVMIGEVALKDLTAAFECICFLSNPLHMHSTLFPLISHLKIKLLTTYHKSLWYVTKSSSCT